MSCLKRAIAVKIWKQWVKFCYFFLKFCILWDLLLFKILTLCGWDKGMGDTTDIYSIPMVGKNIEKHDLICILRGLDYSTFARTVQVVTTFTSDLILHYMRVIIIPYLYLVRRSYRKEWADTPHIFISYIW